MKYKLNRKNIEFNLDWSQPNKKYGAVGPSTTRHSKTP